MKKFYAIAAAAMMSAAAFAQDGAPLYIVGSGTLGWTPEAPKEFTYENGEYSFKYEDEDPMQAFKISTAMGDWETFNGGSLGCPNYGEEAGVVVALEAWGENTMAPWAGKWEIKVAGDLSTLTLVALAEKPELKIYLRGDMCGDGWPALPEWEMTRSVENNDNWWQFTCADTTVIPAGTGFKFADAAWGSANIGLENEGDVMVLDTEMPLLNAGNSKNIALEEEFEGIAYLQIDPAMVYFSTDGSRPSWLEQNSVNGIEIDNNTEAQYFNLQGVRVAQPESGLYIVVKDGNAVKTLVK